MLRSFLEFYIWNWNQNNLYCPFFFLGCNCLQSFRMEERGSSSNSCKCYHFSLSIIFFNGMYDLICNVFKCCSFSKTLINTAEPWHLYFVACISTFCMKGLFFFILFGLLGDFYFRVAKGLEGCPLLGLCFPCIYFL